MGNYKLDGQEFAGSHLAVDIKIPSGTPVYAIANGVVVKALNQSSGFGYHVVLRHDDVPSTNNADIKTTYYSGYAHLSNYVVAEGDLVSKGQLIGSSGNSGTATTPHLHFQIDNDQAPWHMYWPFTSKDASDAGLNFWEGVSAGLGQERALATTINPLIYVQKYKNSSNNSTSAESSTSVTVAPAAVSTPVTVTPVVTATPTEPATIVAQPTVSAKPAAVELAGFKFKHSDTFTVGNAVSIQVTALDNDGKAIADFSPNGEFSLKLENGGGTLSKSYLSSVDFRDGVAEFSVMPTVDFGLRVSITNGVITATSEVIQKAAFSDLGENDDHFVAVNFLRENNIVTGYSDGSFKPKNPVSRVEALKFVYKGLNKELARRGLLEFSDTDSGAWYAQYILAAQQDSVIKGYSGNLFKPANYVTKAEFLKILMESAGLNVGTFKPLEKPFSDVDINAWYSGYVTVAKEKNLIETSSNLFKPNAPATRGEVAEILYRTVLLQITGEKQFDGNLAVSANDLASFFRTI